MAGNGRGAQKSKNPILRAPDSPMGLEFPAVRPDGQEWLERTKSGMSRFVSVRWLSVWVLRPTGTRFRIWRC